MLLVGQAPGDWEPNWVGRLHRPPAVGSSDGSMTVLVWTRPSFGHPVPHIGGLHHHYERRAA